MDIELYAEQEEWVNKSSDILHKHGAYLDNSMAGLGKSIIVLEHCKRLKIPLVVICPVNAISVWEYEGGKYGVDVTIFTYDQLSRGSANQDILEITEDTYLATDEFYERLEDGLMIAMDEVHLALNNSDRRNALVSLAMAQRDVFNEGKDAYLALLSATPGHSAQHTKNIICLLGIVEEGCDFSKATKDSLLQFAGALVNTLGDDDIKELYNQLLDRDNFTIDKVSQFIVSVYNSRIKGVYTGAIMRAQEKRAKVYNAFFSLDDENVRDVNSAISKIGEVKDAQGKIAIRTVQSVMQVIERNILQAVVSFINYLFMTEEVGDIKVVLFVNYTESVEYVKENIFAETLFVTGSENSDERAENIRLFQEPNMDYPFICLNMKAGASSISLDDRDGKFPRATFIIPSYSYIDDFQAIYRVDRGNLTKSDPYVYICFPRLISAEFDPDGDLKQELENITTQYSVLNNIRAKSTTAKYIKDIVGEVGMVDLMRNPAVVVDQGAEVTQLPQVDDVSETHVSQNIIQGWIDSGKDPEYIESLFQKHKPVKPKRRREQLVGISKYQKIRELKRVMKKNKWAPENVPDGILSSFGLEVEDLYPRKKEGAFKIVYDKSGVRYG